MSNDTPTAAGIDLVLTSVETLDTEQPSVAWEPWPLASAHWDALTVDHLIAMPDDMFARTLAQWRRDTQNGESNRSLQARIEQASQQYLSEELDDEDPGEGSSIRFEATSATDPGMVYDQTEASTSTGRTRNTSDSRKARKAITNAAYREKVKAEPGWTELNRARARVSMRKTREKQKKARMERLKKAMSAEEGIDDEGTAEESNENNAHNSGTGSPHTIDGQLEE
ncbi:hypothetical protein L198_06780 [Cryptococcus wingfieldii CBS 7118]|uniref:Uncharacterized protein n=1 Tax=Cryptococcus wingfieldii CBS 7118 TaxID=1295528 RepID=A0A1E3IK08_9TREE|nr:hypothetical protein L198_06780 [Cryptococcus wingfieldii CBS 7118]ODN88041.1 hypothetical protein L198_06780 [Cryptococcus wingfieldii CBS 7118]